jgi:signal transduction histidine kinase
MESPGNRAFTPLLIFALLALGGIVSATLLLNSVGRSQEELVRLRVALAHLEAESYGAQAIGLEPGHWFQTAESLVPAPQGAKLILSGVIPPEEATRAQIREAAAWIDQYRSRNGRAMSLLMTLLMVTSLLLAFLLYRTGRLVTAVLGERGRALELASRLNRAQEQERSRTARELENGVARALSMASLQLREREPREPALQIDEALSRVRFLVYRMKEPERLGDDLLGPVEELCDAFSRETGIAARCEGEGLQRRWFGRELSLQLYRIVQELLTNAARHSRARSVSITLSERNGAVRLLYTDDGVGIPAAALRGAMGTGLTNMADRAAMLGGSFTVRREEGTAIELLLPLK